MSLSINTNIPSLNAQRRLNQNQVDLSRTLQRLSSGLRINSAKDDAAGLAISDRMTAQIRGLNQASRNANDGISLAQTAEGAMHESVNIIQRIRELAVQSANDTNSAEDRASLQAEVNQLLQEIDRIAFKTTFNNLKILDGTFLDAQFQVGANSNETISVSIPSVKACDLGGQSLATTNVHGIEAATYKEFHSADGANRGAVGSVAAIGASENGLVNETLTIRDAEGTMVGTASVAAHQDLTAPGGMLDDLGGIPGVTVLGLNKVTLSGGTNAGNNSQTIQINGIPLGLIDLTSGDAIATAINGNSTLQGQGVFAVSDGGTGVSLYNNTGADIKVGVTDADDTTAASIIATGINGSAVNVRADTTDTILLTDGSNAASSGQTIIIDGVDLGNLDLTNEAAIANVINSNTTLQLRGISASYDATSVSVFNYDGSLSTTIAIDAVHGGLMNGMALTVDGSFTAPVNLTVSPWNTETAVPGLAIDYNEATFAGTIEVAIPQGFTISSNVGNGLFSSGAADVPVTTIQNGYPNTADGNANGTQILHITGPGGSTDLEIDENASGAQIASAVNSITSSTGIIAETKTVATLFDFSAPGTVSFSLQGTNQFPVSVSADIVISTTNPPDLEIGALADEINKISGQTGIEAYVTTPGPRIRLSQDEGYDIKIANFEHSAAVDAHDQSTSPIADTGATINALGTVQSMKVLGGEGSDSNASILTDGGTKTIYNSTVIGGEVKFYGSDEFKISSSIDATNSGGSLFEADATEENDSTVSSFIDVTNITTKFGCAKAIMALDGAILQLGGIRGDLGAVQNRFESTISNLENISENLSAARSRIMDADIAKETSEMIRQNIIQQAATSILTQANQQPELALSLLRD